LKSGQPFERRRPASVITGAYLALTVSGNLLAVPPPDHPVHGGAEMGELRDARPTPVLQEGSPMRETAFDVSSTGCTITCPAGGIDENEPDCGALDDGMDMTNGGCFSTPILFDAIACGDTYCGTFGRNDSINTDRDMYLFELTEETEIRATFRPGPDFASPSLVLNRVVAGTVCNLEIAQPTTPCGVAEISTCLPPATYALYVRSASIDPFACGAAYTLEFQCGPCVGACCEELAATCTDGLLAADCEDVSGTWYEGAACADITCPGLGACCDEAAEVCSDDRTLAECNAINGIWTLGVPCSAVGCPRLGACCDDQDGLCTEGQPLAACNGPTQTWAENARCCDVECPVPAAGPYPASGVTLLSRVAIEDFPGGPTAANEIWHYVSPGGEEYAILGFKTGTGFVRVTDPVNPVVIDYIDGLVNTTWRDMATFGTYAYVVSDGAGVGLQIMDLSDIDNDIVTLANTTDLGFGFSSAHNVFVNEDSGYLYLALADLNGGLGITAVDLNVDPVDPTLVGSWTDTDSSVRCHDLQVVTYTTAPYAGSEIAYCFAENDGLRIVDVTDKDAMTRLSKLVYPTTTYTHQGWLTEDRRFVLIGDELDETDQPAIENTTTYVVNVNDPADPFLVSQFSNGKCSIDHNLMVRGDFVFEANYATGLRVFDICNVSEVVEVGYFDTHPENNDTDFSGAWGVTTQLSSGVVLVSDRQRGLFVLDVSGAIASVDTDGDGLSNRCQIPIPAVSEWGVIVMLLALLAVGTLVVGRRTA